MKKFESVIVRKIIEFDYTEAVNCMVEEAKEAEEEAPFENKEELKDILTEWFADDLRACSLATDLKFTIK